MSTVYVCVPDFNPVICKYTWRIIASEPFIPQLTWKTVVPLPPIIEPETSVLPKKDADHDHSALIEVAKFFFSENTHIIEVFPGERQEYDKAIREGRHQDAQWIQVRVYIEFWKAFGLQMSHKIWKYVRQMGRII